MKFSRYHALGNDYLVIDPKDWNAWFQTRPTGARELSTEEIEKICHRNFGVGSDGILWGPLPSQAAPFKLRIFNPDGSEAEKSGNGLRIFSRYLWDQKLVRGEAFPIETLGGLVKSVVQNNGKLVQVEMGKVSFWSNEIPVIGPRREVIREEITA